MRKTIPAEVLALKSRFDQWRATRSHVRERVPDDLREAVVRLAQLYSPSLLRGVLKVDPWRMNESTPGKIHSAPKEATAAFFQLPFEARTPASRMIAGDAPGIRLQIERPDGARLTLASPALDLDSVRQFCADFLRHTRS